MKRLLILCCSLAATPAFADDFSIAPGATQDSFNSVSKDIVDAFSYPALTPAEATGITGIGVGGFGNYMKTDKSAWENVTGQGVKGIGMAGVIAHKGLPLGLDVGAFYGAVPQSGGGVVGAELRYAILEGGVATPGLAIRGGFTHSVSINDLSMTTYSLDATISKGFAFLTPYAGAGYVWGKVEDKSSSVPLNDEEPKQGRVYVGLRLSAGFLEITPEYERIGSNDVYNLRLGFSI